MKRVRLLIFLILNSVCFTLTAQVKMRDVFAAMPDSILPFISTNNRLDCIDYIENGMQARVKNRIDDYIELKQLTDDYLFLQTSDVSSIELKLLPQTDTTMVICMVRTCAGPLKDSDACFFTQDWKPMPDDDGRLLRPAVEDYFAQTMDAAIYSELKDLYLSEAHLSPDDATLTWTITLDVMSRDNKKAAQGTTMPVVVDISFTTNH